MAYFARSLGVSGGIAVVLFLSTTACNQGTSSKSTTYENAELEAATEVGSILSSTLTCSLSGSCLNLGGSPALTPGSLTLLGAASLSPPPPSLGLGPGTLPAGDSDPVADDEASLVFNRPYDPVQTPIDPFACDPSLRPLGGGVGSEARPFLICHPAHLEAFLGESASSDEEESPRYYQLVSDLELLNTGVTPSLYRLRNSVLEGKHPITGRQYVIRNLRVTRDFRDTPIVYPPVSFGAGGLFGEAVRSEFRNLVFSNLSVTVYAGSHTVFAGGLVGRAESSRFRNIQIDGVLNFVANAVSPEGKHTRAGGLVGFADRTEFSDVRSNELTVLGRSPDNINHRSGGLVGEADTSVLSRVSVAVQVKDTSKGFVGGLAGEIRDSILEDIEVKARSTSYAIAQGDLAQVGGFAGNIADSRIESVRVLGNTRSLTGFTVGGIAAVAFQTEMEWVRGTDLHLKGAYIGGLFSNLVKSDVRHSAFRGALTFTPSSLMQEHRSGLVGGIAAYAHQSSVLRVVASGSIAQENSTEANSFNASGGFARIEAKLTAQENDIHFTSVYGRGYSGGLFGHATSIEQLELRNNRVAVDTFRCMRTTARDWNGETFPTPFGGLGSRIDLAVSSPNIISENNLALFRISAGPECLWGDRAYVLYGGVARAFNTSGGTTALSGFTRYSFFDTSIVGGSISAGYGILGRNTGTLQSNGSHYANWDFSRVWFLSPNNYPALRYAMGMAEIHQVRGDINIDVALPELSGNTSDHLTPIETNTLQLDKDLLQAQPMETLFNPNRLQL